MNDQFLIQVLCNEVGFKKLILNCSVFLWICIASSGCLEEGKGSNTVAQGDFNQRGAYPSEPYGTEIGSVIAPLQFIDGKGQSFTLEQLYNNSMIQLLLITTSAEWCTACIKEQPALQSLYERYYDRGLEVMVSLFQDSDFEPATPELSVQWAEKYNLSFPVVCDPAVPSTFSPYYDVNLTPMVMLVNANTMEIIYLTQGFDEDQVSGLIEANLPSKLPKPRDYPSEPYGVMTGQVIQPLSFVSTEGDPFKTEELYQDLSKQLLLFTTSAEWCTACIKEQPKLQELYERFGDLGLEVMVSLFQDSDFEPATAELAARWRDKYDLSFMIVADPVVPSTMSPYYDVNLTPMVMLVDLLNMEIIYLTQGFDEDQVEALIESRLGSAQSSGRQK